MNVMRNHAPNRVPNTKLEIPEVEKKVGNAVIFVEDLVTALLTDEHIQKHPTFSTVVEGCNRLIEGKFWLTAVLSALQKEREGNGALPKMPNGKS